MIPSLLSSPSSLYSYPRAPQYDLRPGREDKAIRKYEEGRKSRTNQAVVEVQPRDIVEVGVKAMSRGG